MTNILLIVQTVPFVLLSITLLLPVAINSLKSLFHITLFRFSVVPDVSTDHVLPSYVPINPVSPTITNNPRSSEYAISLKLSDPVLILFQLLPLMLVNIAPLFPTTTIVLLPLDAPYNVSAEADGVIFVHDIPSKLFNITLCVIVGITL